MEDNYNNNMEDFFRKKLSENSDNDDDWDKPDASVWNKAQAQIPIVTAKKDQTSKRNHKAWALLLLLLLLGGYTGYLQWQTGALKAELKAKDLMLAEKENALSAAAAKAETAAQCSGLEQALTKEKNARKAEQQSIVANNEALKKQVAQQQKAIAALQESNQRLADISAKKSAALLANAQENAALRQKDSIANSKKSDTSTCILPLLAIEKMQPVLANKEPKMALENLGEEDFSIKKTWKKWEVGAGLTMLSMAFPSKEPSGLGSSGKPDGYKAGSKNTFLWGQSLSLGYAIKEQLYLRTGIRRASGKIERNLKIVKPYDEANNYINDNGNLANSLDVSMRTPYTEDEGTVEVEIPQGANLQTGDMMVVLLSDQQHVNYLQVPLGIDYFYGNKKLQGFIQAGLSWNMLHFSRYQSSVEIEAQSQLLASQHRPDISNRKPTKHFLGTYAGLGINYSIHPNWQLRAGFAGNFNFIRSPHQPQHFAASDLMAFSMNLGVNYRF